MNLMIKQTFRKPNICLQKRQTKTISEESNKIWIRNETTITECNTEEKRCATETIISSEKVWLLLLHQFIWFLLVSSRWYLVFWFWKSKKTHGICYRVLRKKNIDRYRQIIDSLFLVFFPKENNDSANPRNELIRAQRPGLSGTLFIRCRWLMVV